MPVTENGEPEVCYPLWWDPNHDVAGQDFDSAKSGNCVTSGCFHHECLAR